eukprot:snap_masked-scaffold_1-processed-gene-6.25-mRNA-1 protein AED:1.00 eAED:1.00 QI:0/0/0/0/1/1/3/0/348
MQVILPRKQSKRKFNKLEWIKLSSTLIIKVDNSVLPNMKTEKGFSERVRESHRFDSLILQISEDEFKEIDILSILGRLQYFSNIQEITFSEPISVVIIEQIVKQLLQTNKSLYNINTKEIELQTFDLKSFISLHLEDNSINLGKVVVSTDINTYSSKLIKALGNYFSLINKNYVYSFIFSYLPIYGIINSKYILSNIIRLVFPQYVDERQLVRDFFAIRNSFLPSQLIEFKTERLDLPNQTSLVVFEKIHTAEFDVNSNGMFHIFMYSSLYNSTVLLMNRKVKCVFQVHYSTKLRRKPEVQEKLKSISSRIQTSLDDVGLASSPYCTFSRYHLVTWFWIETLSSKFEL